MLELAKSDNYSVHGLLTSREAVDRTRKRLIEGDLHGKSSVELFGGDQLPYIANLVSLLVCESPDIVPDEEVLRVLSPGGLALVRDGVKWKMVRKPVNPETDQWPQHFYGADNNPVSSDALVAPPRHLQWRGGPRWGRFHEKMSSFAAMVSSLLAPPSM